MIIYASGIKHSSTRAGIAVDTIVLHATASSSATSTLRWFRNTWSKASAHYIIDKDGTVYKCVPDHMSAWHAGKSFLPQANRRSIGIELVNRNNGVDPYPDAQLLSLRQLIIDLKRKHPIRYLVSHAEIARPKGRKSDPKGLNMQELREWAQLDYTIDAPAARVTAEAPSDQEHLPDITQDDTAGTERA
ncbi:MAG: N-acetylmuramoyl-L-alanine amidase [Armatimonadetes bacterium]|nr:N-acetylmuramoyl-L-alanine amidase [Armatimonadota bacterium]